MTNVIKAGDIVLVYGEEMGIVRSVQPYFGAIVEYWIEMPDKYESATSEDVVKAKPTFTYLAALAPKRNMRLERANPQSPVRGMRSGYILWTRQGTWLRVGSLMEVSKELERRW